MRFLYIVALSLSVFAPSALAATHTQTENAKPGTTAWKITATGSTSGVIEGYASLTSVNRGGRISFFVNTTAPSFTMEFFRWGYYAGNRARKMMNTVTVPGRRQAACPVVEAATKLVECNWVPSYTLDVPNTSDPTNWMSGFYLVKLTESATGKQQYIRFVVRDDSRYSDVIWPLAVNTDAAYNPWGGYSLYGDLAHRGDFAYAANKVSFNRPFHGDTDGAGHFFSWEADMITFLEKEGYDVTYATNVDMDVNPTLLFNHKSYMCVGHDEYWTKAMRDSVEAAIARGISANFLCGNSAYWQVRYEDSQLTNTPGRTLVGYKDDYRNDPITPDALKTYYFRRAPVNRPEDSMMGVMFTTMARPIGVVEDASHWAFTGTGLKNGDRVTYPDGTPCFGYEVDAMGPGSPANTQRLMHSPANQRQANYADMTTYRAPSGATVFASGSISWCHTHPGMMQVLRNVLARSITGSFADTQPIRPSLPAPFRAANIGDVGRAGFVSVAGANRFTLNGAGRNGFSGGAANDAFYYVYQPLTGDGEIIVRLTSHQLFWNNRAGIMIRESLAANARYVALVSRPSESTGTVNEGAEFRVRSVTGGSGSRVAAMDLPLPNWLRLVRSGNTFTASLSADGATWSILSSTALALPATAYIGVAVASARYGVWATAVFDNVRVSGGSAPPPADITKPVVSITAPTAGSTVGGSVALSASASDNVGVVGVQFKVDGMNVGSEDVTAPYSVPWNTTTAANGSHTVTATARDADGNSATSTIGVTVSNALTTPSLPSGWLNKDIGAVGAAGKTTHVSGTFTLKGSGGDIWGSADGFHYAYTQLTGDGSIVARVASVSAEHAWVKAGVMIRKSLTASSAHALMLVSPSRGVAFQRRTVDGASTVSIGITGITAPRWIKLERIGSVIKAYQSSTAASWSLVGSETIAMGSQVYVGLALTSHVPGTLATAAFDNVSVKAASQPTGQCSSVKLTDTNGNPPVLYAGGGEANWTLYVAAPDPTCAWTLARNQTWTWFNKNSALSSVSGTGSSTVALRVVANTTGASRTGSMTLNGVVYTVKQQAN